jgi:hypothetical protein
MERLPRLYALMRVPHIRISFYFLPPPFRPFPPLNSVVSSLCPHCRPVLRPTAVKNAALSNEES